jgi:guanylate kinase
MIKKGLLIVISGPSGAGKGTICKSLVQKNNVWLSVSATTRTPREGEEHGKNYFFISREQFIEKIDGLDFLEHAEVYGNYYGTPRSSVIEMIDSGKDVILEIDIQGALRVKETYKEGVFIFILPPSMKELENRIVGRGSETQESLMTRLKAAYDEINYISRYNYAVINKTVDETVNKIESIIIAEKCRVDRIKGNIFDPKEGLINEQFND